jgi:hypothetical protein
MGSATSKSRKKPQHLPKVGTHANMAYEAEERRRFVGGPYVWIVLGALLLVIIALLVLTVL